MKRRIYALRGLPPEVVAVAFAKTSRSPEQIDKIAAELNEDKSRRFHEKWVVGYGHSSVAEHAVISLALEDVSIIATKVIEDNRLASYTEKSTRYQEFNKESYYKPDKIMKSSLGPKYKAVMDFLFESYLELYGVMLEFFRKRFPDEPEIMLKNRAFDCVRYLLPAATVTTLGMTINARNLEHGIVKLLTHPLDEMKDIGKEIKEAALKITPTLIKYTNFNEYLANADNQIRKIAKGIGEAKSEDGAVLVEYDKDAINKVVAALLYRGSRLPYKEIKKKVEAMQEEEKEKIIDSVLEGRSKFDRPLREFEHCYYSFDITMDYGGFRDVQRHRMCTQTNQDLGVTHGYDIPDEIKEAGVDDRYREAMEKAAELYNEISKEMPQEAQYCVPLGFKKKVLMTFNLREAFHFIKLRSGEGAHASYKRIAQDMYKAIREVHPIFAKHITCDMK